METDSFICRVCLLSDWNVYSLQANSELRKEYTFLQMFNTCTHLEALEIDDLPQFICQSCSNDLQISFDFLIKAIASDNFLKTQHKSQRDVRHHVASNKDVIEKPVDSIDDVTLNEELAVDGLVSIKVESKYEECLEVSQGYEKEFENFAVRENTYEDQHLIEDDNDYSFNGTDLDLNETFDENNADSEIPTTTNSEPKISKKKTKQSVECGNCGKILRPMSLGYHLKRCRKEEKIYLCSSCPKSFAVKSDLRNHMRMHDTKRQRRHVCSECGRGFFDKQSLQVHMNRHMGIKEFFCKICPKSFTTKQTLLMHEFTHNRELGKLICKYCDKKFSSKSDLIVHERFHTGDFPYQCEFCNKSYAVKSHFNYHLAKHKGVTYKCDQCDKEFLNRGSLSSHKFKHDEHMPHECLICKKGFPTRYKLNRHTSIHKSKGDNEDQGTMD